MYIQNMVGMKSPVKRKYLYRIYIVTYQLFLTVKRLKFKYL